MQTIRIDEEDDYLYRADSFETAKTIKIVEAEEHNGTFKVVAITFPRTFLVQYVWETKATQGEKLQKELLKRLKEHGHCLGSIRETIKF